MIPRVQTYGRFVKDIKEVDKFRAEGPCKMKSLHLPSGKGSRLPIRGQIAEADLNQKIESLPDLLKDCSKRRIALFFTPGFQKFSMEL